MPRKSKDTRSREDRIKACAEYLLRMHRHRQFMARPFDFPDYKPKEGPPGADEPWDHLCEVARAQVDNDPTYIRIYSALECRLTREMKLVVDLLWDRIADHADRYDSSVLTKVVIAMEQWPAKMSPGELRGRFHRLMKTFPAYEETMSKEAWAEESKIQEEMERLESAPAPGKGSDGLFDRPRPAKRAKVDGSSSGKPAKPG